MIYKKIDKLIAEAMTLTANMKQRFGENSPQHTDAIRSLNLWREVKTELTNITKGDEKHPGIPLPNDLAELDMLVTMYNKRKSAIKAFEKAGNDPLAQEAIETNKYEMNLLEAFLPKKTSAEDVKKEAMCVIKTLVELETIKNPGFDIKTLQRYTKDIITKVKEKYPDAENGVIAGCVKEYANS